MGGPLKVRASETDRGWICPAGNINGTRMLLEDAVRMQAPVGMWGGTARRKSPFERTVWHLRKGTETRSRLVRRIVHDLHCSVCRDDL